MFAIVLGVSLAKLEEKGKPLLDFFTSLSDAMMTITTWVINLAPVGVFFLIGGQVLGTQDFGKVLEQLGWYFSTVIIGLCIHGFLVLPALYTLDRCRTTINVIGDSIGAGIVNHLSQGELEAMDQDGVEAGGEECLPLTQKDNGELKA